MRSRARAERVSALPRQLPDGREPEDRALARLHGLAVSDACPLRTSLKRRERVLRRRDRGVAPRLKFPSFPGWTSIVFRAGWGGGPPTHHVFPRDHGRGVHRRLRPCSQHVSVVHGALARLSVGHHNVPTTREVPCDLGQLDFREVVALEHLRPEGTERDRTRRRKPRCDRLRRLT